MGEFSTFPGIDSVGFSDGDNEGITEGELDGVSEVGGIEGDNVGVIDQNLLDGASVVVGGTEGDDVGDSE